MKKERSLPRTIQIIDNYPRKGLKGGEAIKIRNEKDLTEPIVTTTSHYEDRSNEAVLKK